MSMYRVSLVLSLTFGLAVVIMVAPVFAEENTGFSCTEIRVIAEPLVDPAMYAAISRLSTAECAEVADLTRSELEDMFRSAMYDPDWEPDYVTAHTNSGDEGIPVPPHSHDAQQGGIVGRHESFFSDWLYHKWRHAGQDQDHIVITVELDHHYSHFHLARNLEHFLLVGGTQARIHRYRDIEESGSLEAWKMETMATAFPDTR